MLIFKKKKKKRVSAYIPEGEFDTTPATWVWNVIPEEPLDTVITSAEDGNEIQ